MTEDGNSRPPLHEAVLGELPPEIASREGAMAHEEHGYATKLNIAQEPTETHNIPVTIASYDQQKSGHQDDIEVSTESSDADSDQEKWPEVIAKMRDLASQINEMADNFEASHQPKKPESPPSQTGEALMAETSHVWMN
jgi:hypothetical protein